MALDSSAVALTSRARRPTRFKDSAKKDYRILADIREAYGLKIVTEALDEAGVDLVERYGDMIQIGARNGKTFAAKSRSGKRCAAKRGLSATLDEWLLAAEYVMAEGNYQVVLCERGIHFNNTHTQYDGPGRDSCGATYFTCQ